MTPSTMLMENTITELPRKGSAFGTGTDTCQPAPDRVTSWHKVAKRGTGIGVNVLTGLPAPDQI